MTSGRGDLQGAGRLAAALRLTRKRCCFSHAKRKRADSLRPAALVRACIPIIIKGPHLRAFCACGFETSPIRTLLGERVGPTSVATAGFSADRSCCSAPRWSASGALRVSLGLSVGPWSGGSARSMVAAQVPSSSTPPLIGCRPRSGRHYSGAVRRIASGSSCCGRRISNQTVVADCCSTPHRWASAATISRPQPPDPSRE
jgi:hypothetical protein